MFRTHSLTDTPTLPSLLSSLQRGELSEAALMEDQSLFHVKLTPMAEGVAWSSDATQAAQQASGSGSGVDSGGHDEL